MAYNKKNSGRGSKAHSSKRSVAGAVAGRSRSKSQPSEIFEGVVRMTQSGNAFIHREDDKVDVVIPEGKTMHALHGDHVRFVLKGFQAGFQGPTGKIISVVERSKLPHVGVLLIRGDQAWVLMESRTMPYDISVDVLDERGNLLTYRKKQAGSDEETIGGQHIGALRKGEDNTFYINGVKIFDGSEETELKATRGMKVAVVVDGWARNESCPYGHIVDVLGDAGDNNTEMHAILTEYGLPYRFEKEVVLAADKISEEITAKDLEGRRDFRDTLTFTIDPADAKDFDDALSFKKLDNGNYEVGVHIADVSYYVHPGDIVDKEARERGTSVYLVDRTVPMLPEKLCNKLCSLRPGEDKLTFSVVFEITPTGKVFNQWFGRTVINSDYRFAYETAQQILDLGSASLDQEVKGGTNGRSFTDDSAIGFSILDGSPIPREQKEAILVLWDLAKILREVRFSSGAVSFERPEMKIECDPDGKPLAVHQHISKEANWLIEEFMLLANRSVAEWVATGGKMNGKARKDAKTFVYRVHDLPNTEKLDSLSNFAQTFGYRLNFSGTSTVSQELNSMLDKAKDRPEFMPLELLALRAMAKACYSTDNIGHYGLAFRFYTHFTSPIRRYPDLMVHRLLARYLASGDSADKARFEEECEHASEREVIAANAERDSIKYKIVEFMEDKVGKTFTGHISGITSWGMYVEIEPTKIEGMVPLRSIRSDFYEFDEMNYVLVGSYTGNVYRLGDEVNVKVAQTNLAQRLLDFDLVENVEVRPQGRNDDALGDWYGGGDTRSGSWDYYTSGGRDASSYKKNKKSGKKK